MYIYLLVFFPLEQMYGSWQRNAVLLMTNLRFIFFFNWKWVMNFKLKHLYTLKESKCWKKKMHERDVGVILPVHYSRWCSNEVQHNLKCSTWTNAATVSIHPRRTLAWLWRQIWAWDNFYLKGKQPVSQSVKLLLFYILAAGTNEDLKLLSCLRVSTCFSPRLLRRCSLMRVRSVQFVATLAACCAGCTSVWLYGRCSCWNFPSLSKKMYTLCTFSVKACL